tara:strand:+ start:121 stop:771 length:651 start_codon:yes stop_codon:yes gene_type:complete
MKKKYKVTFLLDNTNLWIENKLRNYNFKLNNKYNFKISKNLKKIINQDIVILLSYTKILPESFLQKNSLVLVAHPSKLPRDKGFAPVQYQILKNCRKICISLIKATKKVDAGPIYLRSFFKLKGTELSNEIRDIQGKQIINMIKKFLVKFPNVKSKKQIGKGNFNKRRHPKDSKLNIDKTIKQQFNHLRINDNELFPSFFYYKEKKYIIKIYKEKK